MNLAESGLGYKLCGRKLLSVLDVGVGAPNRKRYDLLELEEDGFLLLGCSLRIRFCQRSENLLLLLPECLEIRECKATVGLGGCCLRRGSPRVPAGGPLSGCLYLRSPCQCTFVPKPDPVGRLAPAALELDLERSSLLGKPAELLLGTAGLTVDLVLLLVVRALVAREVRVARAPWLDGRGFASRPGSGGSRVAGLLHLEGAVVDFGRLVDVDLPVLKCPHVRGGLALHRGLAEIL